MHDPRLNSALIAGVLAALSLACSASDLEPTDAQAEARLSEEASPDASLDVGRSGAGALGPRGEHVRRSGALRPGPRGEGARCPGAGALGPRAGCAGPRNPTSRFEQLDADGDAGLTAQEVGEWRWGRLQGADDDGDGRVSLVEFQAAHGDGRLAPPRGGRGGKGSRPRSYAEVLERHDVDSDEALQVSELPEFARERLAGADANGDGVLSEAEWDAARADRRAGGRPGGPGPSRGHCPWASGASR